jgi:superfamily II DNA helicase RecQ
MILQAVSLLLDKSITLVVLPLNQIGVEQANYIENIGGRPCFLNRETFSSELLDRIQAGKFTHVLLSPELAISGKFRPTAIHPGFRDRLALVVVDEAHLVAQWGKNFRTDYARLHQLRSLFGSEVPWFACSATLDMETLHVVIEGLGFPKDVEILRTSINRPELLIQTAWIPQGAHKKATALRFLFDNGPCQPILRPSRIPKTLVFFDSKNDAYTAMENCRYWLQQNRQPDEASVQHCNYSLQEAMDTVKVYHSNTAKADKEAMIKELQKPGPQSKLRVLMTTEALALGVDLQDIDQVVMYRFPKNLQPATLWQRGGRACRLGQDGKIIILVDQWIQGGIKKCAVKRKIYTKNVDLEEDDSLADSDDEAKEVNPERPQKGGRLSHEERRAVLPEFWYLLANEPTECLRKRFLDYFNEPEEFRGNPRHDRCCSNCNPEYQLNDPTRYLYTEYGHRPGGMSEIIINKLKYWSKEVLSSALKGVKFIPDCSSILAEEQYAHLAMFIENATYSEREYFQAKDLQTILGIWTLSNQLAESLVDVLKNAYQAAFTASIQTPAKRKRVSNDSSQMSECSNLTWSSAVTPESTSQPTPSQNISPWVDINTPSQAFMDMPPPSATPVPKRKIPTQN